MKMVNLIAHNINDTVKQRNNSLYFFSIIFITTIFIYLFIYETQSKQRTKLNQSFNEFTDYLLVKDTQRRKYDLKVFQNNKKIK